MGSHIRETQRSTLKATWMQLGEAHPWMSNSASQIHFPLYPSHKVAEVWLQEGGYLPGLRVGSGPTLRNELSKETHVLTKQETLLGRGAQAEELPKWHQRTCLPMQETSAMEV